MKATFNLDLLKFPAEWWKHKGMDIYSMIKTDADEGKMQDGQSGIQYKSEQYKKYKSNYMKRLTKGEGKTFTDKEGYFFGKTYFKNKKAKPGKGKRLGTLSGVQVTSNETSFVNMQLTGRLFRGLQASIASWSNNLGVKLGYDNSDKGKVFGAEDLGRNIVGLSETNADQVFQDVLEVIDKNIQDQFPDDIKIIIS